MTSQKQDRQTRTRRPARERDRLDVVLGFLAAGALVGIPVAIFTSIGPWSFALIVIGAGVLGGLYGDDFLLWVADSTWWTAIRGYFRHWWL